jgi:hypothetical protein
VLLDVLSIVSKHQIDTVYFLGTSIERAEEESIRELWAILPFARQLRSRMKLYQVQDEELEIFVLTLRPGKWTLAMIEREHLFHQGQGSLGIGES